MNRSKAGAFRCAAARADSSGLKGADACVCACGGAYVGRRWLADTFGRDVLGSGTGLLDIAGGKGELSFELANLTGVPTTVVDPRPLQLDRFIKRCVASTRTCWVRVA